MPNHFHLVVETPQGNLVAGMQWLLGAYTGRFNRRHKLFGHLFSGRYKALIVDGSGDGSDLTKLTFFAGEQAQVHFRSRPAARSGLGEIRLQALSSIDSFISLRRANRSFQRRRLPSGSTGAWALMPSSTAARIRRNRGG